MIRMIVCARVLVLKEESDLCSTHIKPMECSYLSLPRVLCNDGLHANLCELIYYIYNIYKLIFK